MHTLVICRTEEAARVLRQIAQGESIAIVPPRGLISAVARGARSRRHETAVVYVIEDWDPVPAVTPHSAVLRPPCGGRFSLEAFRTSDLAAAAYSEAFGRALCAAPWGNITVEWFVGKRKGKEQC